MYNVSRHQSLLPDMQRLGGRPADAGSFDEAATGSRVHVHVAKGKGAHSEVCRYTASVLQEQWSRMHVRWNTRLQEAGMVFGALPTIRDVHGHMAKHNSSSMWLYFILPKEAKGPDQ
jgi:hypothetical protein